MDSSTFLLLFFSLLLSLPNLTLSQLLSVVANCSQTSGNYTPDSAFDRNLNSIISQFATLTLQDYNYGFFNRTAGEGADQVHVIALCRADINQTECYRVFNNTAYDLRRSCPFNRAAIAWTQFCLFRYADRNIYGVLENVPRTCVVNPMNASNPSYNQLASNNLLVDLSDEAAAAGPLRKYAAGNASVGDSQMVYASLQCTPDMDQRTCGTCLAFARDELQTCCSGRIGCIVLRPNCVLRFEANPFNFEVVVPLPSPPPPPSPPTGGNGNNSTRTIIIAVIASVIGLTLLNISMCIFMRRRRRNKPRQIRHETTAEDHQIPGADSLQFDFDSILVATDFFSHTNKLGQGGFGAVYKGKLPNGQDIAVKRLSIGSGQGDVEFKTEVVLVAKLQHRNLVRLLGFCLHEHEKLLIYEFVPRGSLDYFIFDQARRAQLDWETRYKIIGGVARGLLYLHEDSRLRVIHRDLKASNILLDAEMIPKIADFGVARLFGQDETQGSTSRIVGTYGYMAPEYVSTGQFSVKSDVFSFGVLLLEIISGQKNNCFRYGEDDEEYILSFAWRSWREGMALNLVDPTLGDESRNEIMRCIHIGLLCAQENVAARPTMASVVLMLNSLSTDLEPPSQPAFSSNFGSELSTSAISTSNISNTELTQLSRYEVSTTELQPR